MYDVYVCCVHYAVWNLILEVVVTFHFCLMLVSLITIIPQRLSIQFFLNSNCRYTDDMELDDAVHTAILTLKEGYGNAI